MNYNLDKIKAISEGDESFIQAVVMAFIDEVPEDLLALEKAINSSEFNMIYQMSHKIKPNLDLLGMQKEYTDNLKILEWAKAKTDIDKITSVFKKVNDNINNNISELKKEFNL